MQRTVAAYKAKLEAALAETAGAPSGQLPPPALDLEAGGGAPAPNVLTSAVFTLFINIQLLRAFYEQRAASHVNHAGGFPTSISCLSPYEGLLRVHLAVIAP